MENQVPEPNCILRVNGCSCDECCLKLRTLLLKVDGVESVGLDGEKRWVLLRGDADPIKLLGALNLKGREAEIMYYCKLELRDINTTPDYHAAAVKTPQPNSAEKKSGHRRRPPKCRLHGSDDDDEEEENVLYSGHVRESYVAAVPPQAEEVAVHARKECSVPDCPFHDCYLKSLAPPPPAANNYGYMLSPYYGFQQLPPAPWGYGYGRYSMM
ncbi:PREDICTED: uncharacterized protein LOC109152212 [Ipomoea nil]|uniref:uncharacterized protein LOC109152212 n=1 Tax=Ipomoea nil TaxID=35883 RepID=UPI0009012FA6|nr:PREDICTED: uncharacterized protein LOC109152212 [Ipomoea nil]